jgi:hypothetical protein
VAARAAALPAAAAAALTGDAPAAAASAADCWPSRRVPQELQKRDPGGFVVPHVGHGLARRVPHALQKRAPAMFSVAQVGQITPAPP